MYFITLSEMLGTHGGKIARQTASALNYGFVGEVELFRAAKEMGFFSDVKELDERSPNFLERFFSERPRIHLDRLQSVIYEVAQKGNTVFFGKGSQLMLSSFGCALHVLVTGSLEKRIQRVMEEHGVGREVAEKMIEKSDHDRSGFIRFAFNEDWLNPKLYDLVLNTDKLSLQSGVDLVVSSAKSDEIKACGIDSVTQLGKLSLLRKVESGLLEAGLASSHVFVSVEDPDTVRLYGFTYSSEEKNEVDSVVKRVGNVKKIINDLQVFRGNLSGA
jgi:cytidylate kinase